MLSACSNSPDCFRKEMVITERKAQMKLSVYYSTWASLLLSSQQSWCLSEFWSDCWWQSWKLTRTGPCMHQRFSALLVLDLRPRLSLMFWHQFFSLCCESLGMALSPACAASSTSQAWAEHVSRCGQIPDSQHSLLTSSSQNPDAQWPRSSQFSCETNLLFLMINVSCREDG